MSTKNIAIFASGEGTNAKAIIDYFKESQKVRVVLIVSDNQNSPVLEMARANSIKSLVITKDTLKDSAFMLRNLSDCKLDLIVLAGFMRIIPDYLVEAYEGKILNIHPAIDKKYDGKTGKTIPEEVIKNSDVFHGSRVHVVTTEVDGGEVLDSESFVVGTTSPEELRSQIKRIEHLLYPRVIEGFLKIR
jgi:phosphoribosylglycinamide formyltransferase-1